MTMPEPAPVPMIYAPAVSAVPVCPVPASAEQTTEPFTPAVMNWIRNVINVEWIERAPETLPAPKARISSY